MFLSLKDYEDAEEVIIPEIVTRQKFHDLA